MLLSAFWTTVRLSWIIGCVSSNTASVAYKHIIQYRFNVTTFNVTTDDNIILGWKCVARQATYIVVPQDTSDMVLYHYVKKYGSLSQDIVFLLVDMGRFELGDVEILLKHTAFLNETKQDGKRVIAIVNAHEKSSQGLLLSSYKLSDLRQKDHREVPLSDLYRIVNIHFPDVLQTHGVDGYMSRNVYNLAPL